MRLTPLLVELFEADQRKHGTETAIFNLLWLKATDDLRDINVRRVTTIERDAPRRRPRRAAA